MPDILRFILVMLPVYAFVALAVILFIWWGKEEPGVDKSEEV